MWLISPGIIFSRLPRWLSGKESAYQRRKGRRRCFDHGTGRSGVGNGNPLQYSSLDNSMDRGTCWAAVYRVTKSQTQLSDWANTHTVLSESICVVESGRISLFLWLSNILVYACTCMCVCACVCVCVYCMDPSVYLSHFLYPLSHLLMDILTDFTSWLLQIMLLWIFGCMYLSELAFWGPEGRMGKSRFAGSYDSSVFIFLTTSIVFSMEWKLEWLHQFTLHQWCKSVPLSSHPFPDHCSPHSLQSSLVVRLEWSVCSAQVGHILN